VSLPRTAVGTQARWLLGAAQHAPIPDSGSEPGVLTLNYLATTAHGQSYVVSVLTEDPSASFNQARVTAILLSAIKGALTLAAR
jgi:hypothetical protein